MGKGQDEKTPMRVTPIRAKSPQRFDSFSDGDVFAVVGNGCAAPMILASSVAKPGKSQLDKAQRTTSPGLTI
jgi:hypothetical protein